MKFRLFLFATLVPLSLLAQVANQQTYIDSLVATVPIKKNDTIQIKLLQDIAYAFSNVSPDKSIKYAAQALAIAERIKNEKWIASSNGMLAISHNSKGDFNAATIYNQKALDIYNQLNDKKKAAAIYANLSLIYLSQGNYLLALKNGFDALRIYEESHADKNTAIVLENIGHIYFEQKNYPKTKDYYTRALNIYKKSGKQEDISRANANIARIFQANGNYSKALSYLFKALSHNEKSGLDNSIQNNLANIGNVYMKLNDYAKAIKYHSRALEISRRLGVKSSIAINYGNLGCTYLAQEKARNAAANGNADQPSLLHAVENLEKAVALCREIGFLAPLAEFNEALVDAYQLSGNYKQAFTVLEHNTALKDSLFSLQSKKELSALDTKRDVELKNKDIIIKKIQLRLNEEKAANERIVYLCGIFLLCALIFGLFTYFRRKARSHRNQMDNIIQIQAHMVRGPVASILGLAQLLDVTNPNDPTNKEMLGGISKIAQDLNDVILDVIRTHK